MTLLPVLPVSVSEPLPPVEVLGGCGIVSVPAPTVFCAAVSARFTVTLAVVVE